MKRDKKCKNIIIGLYQAKTASSFHENHSSDTMRKIQGNNLVDDAHINLNYMPYFIIMVSK